MYAHHQKINQFVWPALAANLSAPLLSLADTYIISHFGDSTALSAVAAGSAAIAMLIWVFGFLRMGTTGEVARAFGTGSHERQKFSVSQALLFASVLGVLLAILVNLCSEWLNQLINPNNLSSTLSQQYIQIRAIGLPATLWMMVISGWLIGIQKPHWNFILLGTVNLLNVVLSYIAVAIFDMNSAGVAFATVFAEYSCLLLSLFLLKRQGLTLTTNVKPKQLTKLLKQNRDLFIRSCFLVTGMTYFTAQSARLGDDVLAINSILLNLLLIVSYTLDGLANAVESLTGEAVGKKTLHTLPKLWQAGAIWALSFGLVFGATYALFGAQFIRFFTPDIHLQQLGNHYSLWLALTAFIAVWAYYLDGLFIGIDHLKAMRNTVIVACLSYVAMWNGLKFYGFENHALWLCFAWFHFWRGGGLAISLWRLHRKNQLI